MRLMLTTVSEFLLRDSRLYGVAFCVGLLLPALAVERMWAHQMALESAIEPREVPPLVFDVRGDLLLVTDPLTGLTTVTKFTRVATTTGRFE